jgi:hypothetical protein
VGAGQHVADEAFVAGNVNHARARAIGQGEIGEAEIDRNSALPLFLETIGLLAGQSANERRLAMVDMAGGADNRVNDG